MEPPQGRCSVIATDALDNPERELRMKKASRDSERVPSQMQQS